jgi:hypothetical protein
MPDVYRVIVLPEAFDDLDAIVDHIKRESPQNAAGTIDRLWHRPVSPWVPCPTGTRSIELPKMPRASFTPRLCRPLSPTIVSSNARAQFEF